MTESKVGEFYKNDIAYFVASNEGGKQFLVKVKVLEVISEFGRKRYLIEPVEGSGQLKVEELVAVKN